MGVEMGLGIEGVLVVSPLTHEGSSGLFYKALQKRGDLGEKEQSPKSGSTPLCPQPPLP